MWITLGPGVFILDTLRIYRGELVMLSEALAEKVECVQTSWFGGAGGQLRAVQRKGRAHENSQVWYGGSCHRTVRLSRLGVGCRISGLDQLARRRNAVDRPWGSHFRSGHVADRRHRTDGTRVLQQSLRL